MLQPPLTDSRYLQTVLVKAGVTPKRSLGQNFLIAPEVVEATVTALSAGPKSITELGAGVGTLTQALVAGEYSVRAIEKDDVLVTVLRKHAPGAEIIHGDLKDTPWPWATPYQLAGNIPYNLTGLIIRRLTQLEIPPTQAVLLVQEEVGERLLASPPDMSLLSLAVQLWGTGQRLLTVPRNCFWPQPKVDSALILLIPHQSPPDKGEREGVLQLAKICFQGKRKQIAGSLKRAYAPDLVAAALAASHIAPTTRPQELAPAQWQALQRALKSD